MNSNRFNDTHVAEVFVGELGLKPQRNVHFHGFCMIMEICFFMAFGCANLHLRFVKGDGGLARNQYMFDVVVPTKNIGQIAHLMSIFAIFLSHTQAVFFNTTNRLSVGESL